MIKKKKNIPEKKKQTNDSIIINIFKKEDTFRR